MGQTMGAMFSLDRTWESNHPNMESKVVKGSKMLGFTSRCREIQRDCKPHQTSMPEKYQQINIGYLSTSSSTSFFIYIYI
jgi:hypothetical protein